MLARGLPTVLTAAVLSGCATQPVLPNPVTIVQVVTTNQRGEPRHTTGFVVKDGRVATWLGAVNHAQSAEIVLNGLSYSTSGRTLAYLYGGVSLISVDWRSATPAAATLGQPEDMLSSSVTMPSAVEVNGQPPIVGTGKVSRIDGRTIEIASSWSSPGTLLGSPVIHPDGHVVGIVTQTIHGVGIGLSLPVKVRSQVRASRAAEITMLFRQPAIPWGPSDLPQWPQLQSFKAEGLDSEQPGVAAKRHPR